MPSLSVAYMGSALPELNCSCIMLSTAFFGLNPSLPPSRGATWLHKEAPSGLATHPRSLTWALIGLQLLLHLTLHGVVEVESLRDGCSLLSPDPDLSLQVPVSFATPPSGPSGRGHCLTWLCSGLAAAQPAPAPPAPWLLSGWGLTRSHLQWPAG